MTDDATENVSETVGRESESFHVVVLGGGGEAEPNSLVKSGKLIHVYSKFERTKVSTSVSPNHFPITYSR